MPYKDPIKAKEHSKEYRQAHKEYYKNRFKKWYVEHKEEIKTKYKAYYKENKEKINEYSKLYKKKDVNSLGQTKENIRSISRQYISKYGTKIPGYEIHHCCTYTEPYKFIYCSREMHYMIHSYLRQHNIDADSDHYEQIKHLLDDTVVKYGID